MGNLSTEVHSKWGLDITQYPKIYSNQALAADCEVLNNNTKQAIWRVTALDTIEEICILADLEPNIPEAEHNRVSLAQLKTVLDPTCVPFELGIFASPKLVAGCIVLMSSVNHSCFEYEYGYLCFRLLTIALNACFLKTGNRLEEITQTMNNTPLSRRDLYIFDKSADLIGQRLTVLATKSTDNMTPVSVGLWATRLPLDTLLAVLDADKKNFSISMRESNSSGYLVLMYALWKYVERERAKGDEKNWLGRLFKPYYYIFARYQLAVLDVGCEQNISIFILQQIQMTARPYQSHFIDYVDSRNLVESYVDYLQRPGSVTKPLSIDFFMNFLTPHLVPGCEDLIPIIFKSSVQLLWGSFCLDSFFDCLIGDNLSGLLYHLCHVLEQLKAVGDDDQLWILRTADVMIEEDLIDLLIIIVFSLRPTVDSEVKQVAENITALAKNLYGVMEFLPSDYLRTQLSESGAFNDWWKYLMNFAAGWVFERPSSFSTPSLCIQLVQNLFICILGDDWLRRVPEFEMMAICRNPRCPNPVGAKYSCPEEPGEVYCGAKCLAL